MDWFLYKTFPIEQLELVLPAKVQLWLSTALELLIILVLLYLLHVQLVNHLISWLVSIVGLPDSVPLDLAVKIGSGLLDDGA